jgi:uncharacterized protein (TIGR02171 family)
LLFILLIVVSLLFCSTIGNNNPNGFVATGMKRIAANGIAFEQGANDSLAGVDEYPVMRSGFTYDYWLDSTEVTQGEFTAVMGGLAVRADTSHYGRGVLDPVYYVSWFDAILFCNARSKQEKLDTVYSYDGAPMKLGGSVYSLTNVAIHYDRSGYRLPTEAEWEYAAREGTSAIPFPHLNDSNEAKGYGWYSANSGDTTHPVAMLTPNNFGLYDMAGNVYEWTNDWRGYYQAGSIINSIGSPVPNNFSERVVKGGSFEHGFSSMRPSRRGTTYPAMQSSAAEYIGFRCARGIIPNGRYIGVNTSPLTTNAVHLIESNVRDFTGTHYVRLVFVNITQDIRTLCFVDFKSSFLGVHEFKDYTGVFKPVISPDGRYVAFCTRNDGQSGAASIYVRSLDSVTAAAVKLPCDSAFGPRWWVDPVSLDTFILYTNSAEDNASATWGTTKTYRWKLRGHVFSGVPEQVAGDGGYHDGLTGDGRFLVTGFTRLMVRDMIDGNSRILFQSPNNGKGAGASAQVCNVSASPDTGRKGHQCLFLDFGAPGGSTLTGRPYGIHEYLFMEDFSNGDSVASWYWRPEGEASWENPAWSNAGRYAAACAANAAGNVHAVYTADLTNATYGKLIEGVELAQPYIWVSEDGLLAAMDGLDLDSLGRYDDPPLHLSQLNFVYRMKGFWRKYSQMQIVFVGSSHTENEVNPRYFSSTQFPVYNMAIGAGDFAVAYHSIVDYVLRYCPSIKLIGLDIIPGAIRFNAMNDAWIQGESLSVGYNYDKNHEFWTKGFPQHFFELMANAPCPTIQSTFDTLGIDSLPYRGWGADPPDLPTENLLTWDTAHPSFVRNFGLLKGFFTLLAEKHIHCLAYITPESPFYRNTNSYGLLGPNRETGRAIVNLLNAFQDSTPYFHFYDANQEGNHDYADSEAFNFDHLNGVGAIKFTKRIDAIVDSILKQHH